MEPLKRIDQKNDYGSTPMVKVYHPPAGTTLAELENLIQKFAPVICLHSGETPITWDVLDYMQKARLVNNSAKINVKADANHLQEVSGASGRFYLEPGETPAASDKSGSVKTYVHARMHDEKHLDIQYWFFRAHACGGKAHVKWLIDGTIKGYEGKIDLDPLGNFNGNWERITVRVDCESGKATQVFYPQPGKGAWLPIDQVQRRGEQVLIFASKSGHCFFPAPDLKQPEKMKFDLYSSQLELSIPDEFGRGKELDFSDSWELISAAYLRAEKPVEPFWLNFQHHWGNPSPDYLSVPFIKRMIPATFGKSLEFLLSKELLDELVIHLLGYFSMECRNKTKGPKFRKCWSGEEEG